MFHNQASMSNKGNIIIKGARVNNLKNIDVEIPRNSLVVITGLSGSGKSSLAFDTLYAEGQRRYVESLSSYARQFLGRMNKPEVVLHQRPSSRYCHPAKGKHPQSAFHGRNPPLKFTNTSNYFTPALVKPTRPYLANLSRTHTVEDVVDYFTALPEGTPVIVMVPFLVPEGRTIEKHAEILQKEGFNRLKIGEEFMRIADAVKNGALKTKAEIFVVVDRLAAQTDKETLSRLADSVETAFFEGKNNCVLEYKPKKAYTNNSFPNRLRQMASPLKSRRNSYSVSTARWSLSPLRRIRQGNWHRRESGNSEQTTLGLRRCRALLAWRGYGRVEETSGGRSPQSRFPNPPSLHRPDQRGERDALERV